MKPFQDNLDLAIDKYLCSLHYSFPGVDSSSNNQVLSGMINCNSYYNYSSIMFELFIYILLK